MKEILQKRKIIIMICCIAVVLLSVAGGIVYCVSNQYQVIHKEVTMELGEPIDTNTSAYIKANKKLLDNTTIDFSDVNENQIGTYHVVATSGKKKATFQLMIQDTTAPVVSSKESVYEVLRNEQLQLKDYIDISEKGKIQNLNLTNQEKEIASGTDIEKTTFILEKAGTTTITVSVTDESGNVGICELMFHVTDEPPVIEGISDGDTFEIYVGESIDILAENEVTATDRIDGSCEVTVNYDEVVKNSEAGSYEVTVSASDKSGNTVNLTVTVKVIEKPVYTASGDMSSGFSSSSSTGTYWSEEQIRAALDKANNSSNKNNSTNNTNTVTKLEATAENIKKAKEEYLAVSGAMFPSDPYCALLIDVYGSHEVTGEGSFFGRPVTYARPNVKMITVGNEPRQVFGKEEYRQYFTEYCSKPGISLQGYTLEEYVDKSVNSIFIEW